MTKRARVGILHQGCIPTYRKPFFEQLCARSDIEYVVFHGDPEPGSGLAAAEPPFPFPNVHVRNRFLRVAGRSIVYQPVLRRIMRGRFDALVIGHEFKFVSSMLLLLLFRLQGRRVLFWGFGPTIDPFKKQRGFLGRCFNVALNWVKSRIIGLASGYIVYTESGRGFVEQAGLAPSRVFVVWNTIDMTAEIAAYDKAKTLERAPIRTELGVPPDAVVLTFIGRLFPPKRVHRLPEAVRKLREEGLPVAVVIVGGGPELEALRAEFGAAPWCRILGPVYDRDQVARILRASDAVVIPGFVGLAVNHAFAHGLPLITCASDIHSPEFEYIVNGRNGVVAAGEDSLVDGLRDFVRSPELRARLAAGALETRDRLDLGRMTANFDEAVHSVLARVE